MLRVARFDLVAVVANLRACRVGIGKSVVSLEVANRLFLVELVPALAVKLHAHAQILAELA